MKYDIMDYGVTRDNYRTCRKLSLLTENQIVEGVRSPSPEIYDCYSKIIFLILCVANTSLDLISDMGITDHRHYDR